MEKEQEYMGLTKGNMYKLKHYIYPMKEGDNVIITAFSPTYGDDSDVQVQHPLYGLYWLNHGQLEEI